MLQALADLFLVYSSLTRPPCTSQASAPLLPAGKIENNNNIIIIYFAKSKSRSQYKHIIKHRGGFPGYTPSTCTEVSGIENIGHCGRLSQLSC